MESITQQQLPPFRILQEELDDDEATTGTIISAAVSNIALFFLVFGLSATVQVRNLREQLTNKFAIFTGVAMQFLIMPFLGFLAVVILNGTEFTQPMGIALLVVTASPGGSYSNWWCSLFNAELALSVAMTSVSSILSIALLPANLFLYTWLAYTVVLHDGGEKINVVETLDFGSIFITLGIVMGAIATGLYAGYKYDNATFHKRANKFGSVCGLFLIIFSAGVGSGAGGSDTSFWEHDWSFYIGVAFPCMIGMAAANLISRTFRLSKPETVAISIECCYQNTAIGTSVAITMFTDPTERVEAVSVPLFYGLVEALIIGLYCIWAWKSGWTKAPSDEKICVVVTNTYEIEEEEPLEFDSAADISSLGWYQKLFIPREQEDKLSAPQSPQKGKKDRGRFYSHDATIATSSANPPGTPDTFIEPIPEGSRLHHQESEEAGDVEAPTSSVPRNSSRSLGAGGDGNKNKRRSGSTRLSHPTEGSESSKSNVLSA